MCTTKLGHKNVHYYSHYEADTVPTSVRVNIYSGRLYYGRYLFCDLKGRQL